MRSGREQEEEERRGGEERRRGEETRRGEERRGEERRGEEEQATDIKSNNPHLAGGEKEGSGRARGRLRYQCQDRVMALEVQTLFQEELPSVVAAMAYKIPPLYSNWKQQGVKRVKG